MKFITNLFKPISADNVREAQLFEARRLALEHEASAEHHAALAEMYRGRQQRLESTRSLTSVGTAK